MKLMNEKKYSSTHLQSFERKKKHIKIFKKKVQDDASIHKKEAKVNKQNKRV